MLADDKYICLYISYNDRILNNDQWEASHLKYHYHGYAPSRPESKYWPDGRQARETLWSYSPQQ